jgi:RNA polymerase sigma factor (sigma-70 family)
MIAVVAGEGSEGRAAFDAADDEVALGEALRSGDRAAIAALHRRYAARWHAMARRALGDAAADDYVQEVLLTIWRRRDRYDATRGPVGAFAHAIARSTLSNARRARGARPEADDDANVEALADPGSSADDQAFAAHRARALATAIANLPEREAAALRLAFFDELSHGEIAETLRIPLGTAKSRVRTGLLRLGVALAAIGLTAAGLLLTMNLRSEREARRIDERALTILTSSDLRDLRLTSPSGAPTHAHVRFRPNEPLAIVTLSEVGDERPRVLFVRSGATVTRVGSLAPAREGRSLTLLESAALAAPFDEAFIAEGESAPPLVVWRAR